MNTTLKIKKWRIFKRLRDSEAMIKELKKENIALKNNTSELLKRRNEFINRLQAPVPDVSISSFSDYKFWLAEPFIKKEYPIYETKKEDIDGVSAIKGLGTLLKKIDEKK